MRAIGADGTTTLHMKIDGGIVHVRFQNFFAGLSNRASPAAAGRCTNVRRLCLQRQLRRLQIASFLINRVFGICCDVDAELVAINIVFTGGLDGWPILDFETRQAGRPGRPPSAESTATYVYRPHCAGPELIVNAMCTIENSWIAGC